MSGVEIRVLGWTLDSGESRRSGGCVEGFVSLWFDFDFLGVGEEMPRNLSGRSWFDGRNGRALGLHLQFLF